MGSSTDFRLKHVSVDVRALLKEGLAEDGWPWDWTTLGSLGDPLRKVRAQLIAKAPGIWAGSALVPSLNSVARELAEASNGHFLAKSHVEDGASVKAGQRVAEWTGTAAIVLALERPFLNLAQYASGIATATRELVSIVRKACPKGTPRVTPTRKTLPGYRDLALHGLIAGGGHAHRVSLSGGVLIKENHVAASGGIGPAIDRARAIAPHGLKIEIEVRDLQEFDQALSSRADVIMLDNFSIEDAKRALKILSGAKPGQSPLIEISGGLTAATIGKYALPGVDVLSVGALTHSVKALDLSLLVDLK